MSTTLSSVSGVYPDDSEQEHGLLPDLNGVDLVMSLSPKAPNHHHHHHHHHHLTSLQHLQNLQHNSALHSHSTPFSVTDILSPIEEYRKLELTANPPSPYSGGSSVNSPSALGPNTTTGSTTTGSSSMANPYAMGPLYHSPGVQGYCAPTDNLSLAGHYTDMRNSAAAGWYGSTASDPRFAISRLMGSSAGGTMGHAMSNMGSLAACSVSDSKPMQFPLAQRRKRRVLFTQAQVTVATQPPHRLLRSCSENLGMIMMGHFVGRGKKRSSKLANRSVDGRFRRDSNVAKRDGSVRLPKLTDVCQAKCENNKSPLSRRCPFVCNRNLGTLTHSWAALLSGSDFGRQPAIGDLARKNGHFVDRTSPEQDLPTPVTINIASTFARCLLGQNGRSVGVGCKKNKIMVKIWFQNHRYKCKRQAKEKAMAEQNQHNQVSNRGQPHNLRTTRVPSDTASVVAAGAGAGAGGGVDGGGVVPADVTVVKDSTSPTPAGSIVLLNDSNAHSPDTATAALLSSYNGAAHQHQMLQQPCNNALMSNSLAMAYRNQNNFMANSHQQQCGGYLPLQTRAW
ncbi:AGAP013315-PB-like protein [Anopheles sinensis]|uniref:AGAP013315-PB-like protein n=1 Tax=Anopheles sinensis TaxID=74873 RepID=A0A084WNQ1_ANOSI|nr:AGAP013315-PB-like protein [Anopheles sinensis]